MSELRHRKKKAFGGNKDEGNKNASLFSTMKSSVLSLVMKKRSGKNIRRIEEMSVIPYVLAFLVFLIFSMYLIDYLHHEDDNTIAHIEHEYDRVYKSIACSKDYGDNFKKCTPKKCGRVVKDKLFETSDVEYLLELAKKGMHFGGGSGGATILDLHSGALSFNDKFVNIYKVQNKVFNNSDFKIYSKVKNIIRNAIASEFDIPKDLLYLTKPTFFSRLTNKQAITKHDEYWHTHIDRVTYGTFYYTSLLYLSDYKSDFSGGRFVFVDEDIDKFVEPKFGRLSFFTSGSENQHFVERVTNGTRYAITVSFTCDKKHAIDDPKLS